MRGYKISVAMAEKSAPRAPPAYNQGYALQAELFLTSIRIFVNYFFYVIVWLINYFGNCSVHLAIICYIYLLGN